MQVWGTNSGWFQLYKYDGETFFNVYTKKVLAVEEGKDQEGQNVKIMEKSDKATGQKWKLLYVDLADPEPTKGLNKQFNFMINKPFFLVSKLYMNRVAECVSANDIRLRTLARKNLGQQFYFDGSSKTIKSKQWTDRSITIQSDGTSSNIYMTTTNARWFQLFKNQKGNIVNEKGKVIEVQGHIDRENQNIGILEKDNGLYQQWDVIYVDEMPKELKKGDTNTMFGLDVERPFFVVTTLESERYLDLIGNNMVLKTPNSFPSQQWYFDQKSRTIKSMRSKNMSWDIDGASKGTNMSVAATNSYKGQLFKWDGESGFVNMYDGRVLDILGGKDEEGQNVQMSKANQSKGQVEDSVLRQSQTNSNERTEQEIRFRSQQTILHRLKDVDEQSC